MASTEERSGVWLLWRQQDFPVAMPGKTPGRPSRCSRYPGTANRVVIDFHRPGVGRTYDETTSDDQEPVTILLQVGGFLGMSLARFLLIWLDAL